MTPSELQLTPLSVWRHAATGGLRVLLCKALLISGGDAPLAVYFSLTSGQHYAADADSFLREHVPEAAFGAVLSDPDR